MNKWKCSYRCLLLENRFLQFASEFWSSSDEVHRKIQLPSIGVVRFYGMVVGTRSTRVEYETSSAVQLATSDYDYNSTSKTFLNSHE